MNSAVQSLQQTEELGGGDISIVSRCFELTGGIFLYSLDRSQENLIISNLNNINIPLGEWADSHPAVAAGEAHTLILDSASHDEEILPPISAGSANARFHEAERRLDVIQSTRTRPEAEWTVKT